MSIMDKLMGKENRKDEMLCKKYGRNIHDIDLKETIKTGIEDRLMQARELDIPYCIVFGSVIPMGNWDKYGNGDWNPPRDYITTDDIATEDDNREQERENIYSFLRGELIEKTEGRRR